MNRKDVHDLHFMHVIKATDFFGLCKFSCQIYCLACFS